MISLTNKPLYPSSSSAEPESWSCTTASNLECSRSLGKGFEPSIMAVAAADTAGEKQLSGYDWGIAAA